MKAPYWLVMRISGEIDRSGFIPMGLRPSMLHETRESAEREALRLAQKEGDPHSEFLVFEAAAKCEPTITPSTVFRMREFSKEGGEG